VGEKGICVRSQICSSVSQDRVKKCGFFSGRGERGFGTKI
jgi:hypothetical protein